jgi:threonine aldolase
MTSLTIDLRSDTVTRPTTAMRAAMAAAEVGDDVYGDDPTVNRLQAVLAERFGYEAGLFFPSGTQSNLCALLAHCQRGDEYLVGQQAHTYKYEQGGAAVFGSIQPQPLAHAADGTIPLESITAAIKPLDDHFARTRLLALENTFGGKLIEADYLRAATRLAHDRGLATHLDGARIYNAVVALGLHGGREREAVTGFDSVSVCLSKGLGAPAGSVLLGGKEFVAQARRWRKAAGGGLRQSGILAAACLHALDHHVARLAEDHANATRLGEGLRAAGYAVDVQTNMVFVDLGLLQVEPLKAHLEARGIVASVGARTRLVTHLDVDGQAIDRVIAAFSEFDRLEQNPRARNAA